MTARGIFLLLLINAMGFSVSSAPRATAQVVTASDQTTLTFEEALALLTQQSASYAKSKISAESADNQLAQARRGFLPVVSASATQQRLGGLTPEVRSERIAGLKAQLNLYRFGADRASLQSAKALASAAQLNLAASELEAESQAAELLINTIEAAQAVATEERLLAVKRSSLDLTRRLFERGARPSQDVEKLSLDLASEEERLRELTLALSAATAKVFAASGQPVRVAPVWPWQNRLLPRLAAKADDTFWHQWQPLGGDQNLAIRSVKERLNAAESDVRAARAQMYPSLDFDTTYNWRKDLATDDFAKTWTAALTLTVPLFNRGTDYYGYRTQIAARQSLEVDLLALQQANAAQTAESLHALQVSLTGLQAREGIRARAKSLYDQSLAAFQKGALSVNDLTTDQNRFLQTESDSAVAWATAHRSLARLCLAVGQRLNECLAKFGA